MIRRKRPKLVMSRIHHPGIQILEKSIVLDTAPLPNRREKTAHEKQDDHVSSSHASFGRSLNVRLVRPKLLNKPRSRGWQ